MKHLIVLLAFLTVNIYGQKPDLQTIIPTSIIVGTFLIVETQGNYMTDKQRALTAYTGMATSAISFFVIRKIKTYANTHHRRRRVYW